MLIGLAVSWFNRWKVRLYARAKGEEAERARNMWRQYFTMDDVPFGARALESDYQTDSVYTPSINSPRRVLTPNVTDSPEMSRSSTPLPPGVLHTSSQPVHGSPLANDNTPWRTTSRN